MPVNIGLGVTVSDSGLGVENPMCSCWSSSLTTNKESFGISSFTFTILSCEARRADGAGWRGRA